MNIYPREQRRSYAIIRLARQWLRNRVIEQSQFDKIYQAYASGKIDTSAVVSSAIHIVLFIVIYILYILFVERYDLRAPNSFAWFSISFAAFCIVICDATIALSRTIYSGFDKALVTAATVFLFLGISLIVRPHVAPEPMIEVTTQETVNGQTVTRQVRKWPTVNELSSAKEHPQQRARHFGPVLYYALILLAISGVAVLHYRTLETGVVFVFAAAWTGWAALGDLLALAPPVKPWAIFVFLATFALSARKAHKSARFHLSHNALLFAEVLAIICMYASINAYVADKLLDATGGLNGSNYEALHWLATFIAPPVLIGIGIVTKNRIALRLGVMCLCFSMLTFQYYFLSDYLKEFLVASGILLLVIVRWLAGYFAQPRAGFIAKPTFTEQWDDAIDYTRGGNSNQPVNKRGILTLFGGDRRRSLTLLPLASTCPWCALRPGRDRDDHDGHDWQGSAGILGSGQEDQGDRSGTEACAGDGSADRS